MKRRTTKLRLHRETLHRLEAGDLRRLAGGGTSDDCFAGTGCDCPTGDTGGGTSPGPTPATLFITGCRFCTNYSLCETCI